MLNIAKDTTVSEFKNTIPPGVVMVDFWAPWCGPCRMLTPIINELEVEFKGRAHILKINVDENHALAEYFGITSIPTLLLFNDGKKVDQKVGGQSKPHLKAFLESVLK